MENPYDKKCSCGKNMTPLPVISKPENSEYYCKECHLSERMSPEVARMIVVAEKKG